MKLNEAEKTVQQQEEEESLGYQLFQFLKEDPLKRMKFIGLLQDFEEFQYNYSKIETLESISESE